ncbi:MAG: hypothetical protein ACRDZ8_10160 [Acidimicrobiales bacterium]
MARPPRWYDYLPPVTATIPCGNRQHRITWQRGKLVLNDHDLSAERAMIALGGQACPCMQVLTMWRDQWSMLPDMIRKTDWLGDRAYLMPAALAHPRQLAAYRNWDRSWRKNAYTTKHATLFNADIIEQATPGLKKLAFAGLGGDPPAGKPKVSASLVRPEERPSVSGSVIRGQMTVTARLGVAWLVRVSARGVALVDDAFVLEVLEDGWSSSLVRATRWKEDGSETRRLITGTAHLSGDPDGSLSLAWTGEEEAADAVHGVPQPVNIFDMDPSKLFNIGR